MLKLNIVLNPYRTKVIFVEFSIVSIEMEDGGGKTTMNSN